MIHLSATKHSSVMSNDSSVTRRALFQNTSAWTPTPKEYGLLSGSLPRPPSTYVQISQEQCEPMEVEEKGAAAVIPQHILDAIIQLQELVSGQAQQLARLEAIVERHSRLHLAQFNNLKELIPQPSSISRLKRTEMSAHSTMEHDSGTDSSLLSDDEDMGVSRRVSRPVAPKRAESPTLQMHDFQASRQQTSSTSGTIARSHSDKNLNQPKTFGIVAHFVPTAEVELEPDPQAAIAKIAAENRFKMYGFQIAKLHWLLQPAKPLGKHATLGIWFTTRTASTYFVEHGLMFGQEHIEMVEHYRTSQ